MQSPQHKKCSLQEFLEFRRPRISEQIHLQNDCKAQCNVIVRTLQSLKHFVFPYCNFRMVGKFGQFNCKMPRTVLLWTFIITVVQCDFLRLRELHTQKIQYRFKGSLFITKFLHVSSINLRPAQIIPGGQRDSFQNTQCTTRNQNTMQKKINLESIAKMLTHSSFH